MDGRTEMIGLLADIISGAKKWMIGKKRKWKKKKVWIGMLGEKCKLGKLKKSFLEWMHLENQEISAKKFGRFFQLRTLSCWKLRILEVFTEQNIEWETQRSQTLSFLCALTTFFLKLYSWRTLDAISKLRNFEKKKKKLRKDNYSISEISLINDI